MKPVPEGKERIVYEGRIFEVVKQPMKIGDKKLEFETARRSPGVRLLIVKGRSILLTKEYRFELDGYDFRLPGGKVFDTLKEYNGSKEDIERFALEAAKKECVEETGLAAERIKHYHTTSPGGTVEWQLHYFIVDKFTEGSQDLERGEDIEPVWKSFEEVKKMCLDGDIKEDRSVGVLLRFLLNEEKE